MNVRNSAKLPFRDKGHKLRGLFGRNTWVAQERQRGIEYFLTEKPVSRINECETS